jgi:F-type H+-transporting ATPase subunit b
MGIDWFTLVAQIANFLILVALLKHFLYNRIIKAMDEREKRRKPKRRRRPSDTSGANWNRGGRNSLTRRNEMPRNGGKNW